jgi:sulfur carrier protein
MNIYINNKETETKSATLAELATELGLPEKGVAMAVQQNMIQRTAWAETKLSEGANILIIKAACGG